MALIDKQNKVIYWDEVNWQWLPYLRRLENGFYLVRNKEKFYVNSKNEAISTFKSFGFCLSPILSLGVTEVSHGTFIYKGKIYQLGTVRLSLAKFLAEVTGKSLGLSYQKLKDKGCISKEIFDELTYSNKIKYEYDGKTYESISSLARDLGMCYITLEKHLSEGKSIKEILEERNNRINITDHLGNRFNTVKSMLKHWGIDATTYHIRRRKGWSLEEALTTPTKDMRGLQEYVDFKGNVFPTAASMEEAYGAYKGALAVLLKRGKTTEEASYILSKRVPVDTTCYDHLGNKFPTKRKMVEVWGIPIHKYYKRIKLGWSLEEALTGERIKPKEYIGNSKECKDHLGNSFKSIRDMCRFWNTTESAYHKRVSTGMSLEDALTLPLNSGGRKRKEMMYTDFKGNSFTTVQSMCDFHGVSMSTLQRHMKSGKTLEEALKYLVEDSKVYDHLGNSFSSYTSMAKYYGLKAITLSHRLKRGWSLEDALTKSTGEVKRYNN